MPKTRLGKNVRLGDLVAAVFDQAQESAPSGARSTRLAACAVAGLLVRSGHGAVLRTLVELSDELATGVSVPPIAAGLRIAS